MKEIFEIAKRGLFAANMANNTIAQNVSNVNTPGYSRQRVDLEAQAYRRYGFSIGAGVNVKNIVRLHDNLLDVQIQHKETELGDLNERSRVNEQMESVLVSDAGGDLDVRIGAFFNTFSDLSADPQDYNLRNILISKAQTLTHTFHDINSGLKSIEQKTVEQTNNTIKEVNSLLKQISSLNDSLVRGKASGKADLNSKDLQSEKLKELSNLVDIQSNTAENGSIEVRIGGVLLVDGKQVRTLDKKYDAATHTFDVLLSNGKKLDIESGKLGAGMDMIKQEIPAISDKLNDIAQTLVEQVNKIHQQGFGLNGSTNVNFFDPGGTTAESIQLKDAIIQDPDKIATSDKNGEPGNNKNALKILDLRDANVLGGRSLLDQTVELISKPGVKLIDLSSSIQTQESSRQLLLNQQENVSGVNIDEEMSNLIRFQNAYQASARVLRTGQEMYDTLLSLV